MTLLVIASIACAGINYGTLCFSDLNAPVIYAYDAVSREGLVIQREPWELTWYR